MKADMDSGKEKRFFQFPLCGLAHGCSHEERVRIIMAYGIVRAGEKQWSKLSAAKKGGFLRGVDIPGFDPNNLRHCAAVYGAFLFQRKGEALEPLLEAHDSLAACQSDFETRYGKDARVRVRADIVVSVQDGGLPPEAFAVLCAIYSLIGNKRIGWGSLAALRPRALGYKSPKVMNDAIPGRADGQKPMSDEQLRRWIDFLHERKFFAFATKGHQMFFSIRMDQSALEGTLGLPPSAPSKPLKPMPLTKKAQTTVPDDYTLDDVAAELQWQTNPARVSELLAHKRILQSRKSRSRKPYWQQEEPRIGPEKLSMDDLRAELLQEPTEARRRQLIEWMKALERRIASG